MSWVAELDTPGRVSPGWVEGQNLLPLPAGHAAAEAAQDALGPLGCECTVVMVKLGCIAWKVSAEPWKLCSNNLDTFTWNIGFSVYIENSVI